jgi:hypothetical protein
MTTAAVPSTDRHRPIFVAQGVIATIAVVAALIGLAAGGSTQAVELAESFETLRTNPYRFAVSQEFTGTGARSAQQGFALDMKGAFDPESGLSKLVMKFGGIGFKSECTYVSDEDDLYIAVHKSRQADIGAKWLHTTSKSAMEGLNFTESLEKLQSDPEAFVGDLEDTGEEATVRGVKASRYSGEMDFGSLFEGSPFSTETTTFPDAIPFDLYLDEDGTPRRFVMTFKTGGSEAIGFVMTQEFYDIGKPLDIKRPAKDGVRDGAISEFTTACFPKPEAGDIPFPSGY